MSSALVHLLQLMSISSNVTIFTRGRDISLGTPDARTHKHSLIHAAHSLHKQKHSSALMRMLQLVCPKPVSDVLTLRQNIDGVGCVMGTAPSPLFYHIP